MTKIEFYLLLVGTATCALLGYGFVVVGRPDASRTRPALIPSAARVGAARVPGAAAPVPPALDAATATAGIEPLPAEEPYIPDQSLLRLCSMVNIANAVNEPPNKTGWQQALPIAEQLLASPCDCAQRNWLKHFVEMGDHALASEEREYNESAQLMATLGRNNAQAVALSKEAH